MQRACVGLASLVFAAIPVAAQETVAPGVKAYDFGGWTVTVAAQDTGPLSAERATPDDSAGAVVESAEPGGIDALPQVTPRRVPSEEVRHEGETSPEGPRSPTELAGEYAAVYASIPFSRTEYNANPSYRHDATMEILLGQPRPPATIRNAPSYVTPPIRYYLMPKEVRRPFTVYDGRVYDAFSGLYSRFPYGQYRKW